MLTEPTPSFLRALVLRRPVESPALFVALRSGAEATVFSQWLRAQPYVLFAVAERAAIRVSVNPVYVPREVADFLNSISEDDWHQLQTRAETGDAA